VTEEEKILTAKRPPKKLKNCKKQRKISKKKKNKRKSTPRKNHSVPKNKSIPKAPAQRIHKNHEIKT